MRTSRTASKIGKNDGISVFEARGINGNVSFTVIMFYLNIRLIFFITPRMYHSNRCTLNRQWDILGTEIYIPHHLNIKTIRLKLIMLKALHSPISLATVLFSQKTLLSVMKTTNGQETFVHMSSCKVFVILCNLNQNQNVWTNFITDTKHKFLRKSFPWQSPWYM
jgi:cold shock CspA family protein